MQKVVETVIVVAGVALIFGVLIYASEHVNCFNFFGLAKGCAIH